MQGRIGRGILDQQISVNSMKEAIFPLQLNMTRKETRLLGRQAVSFAENCFSLTFSILTDESLFQAVVQ